MRLLIPPLPQTNTSVGGGTRTPTGITPGRPSTYCGYHYATPTETANLDGPRTRTGIFGQAR